MYIGRVSCGFATKGQLTHARCAIGAWCDNNSPNVLSTSCNVSSAICFHFVGGFWFYNRAPEYGCARPHLRLGQPQRRNLRYHPCLRFRLVYNVVVRHKLVTDPIVKNQSDKVDNEVVVIFVGEEQLEVIEWNVVKLHMMNLTVTNQEGG